DGLDNDCDGITDEPYLSSTVNVASPIAWGDIEVAPYYFTASSCAGGANGAGTDALAGGGMVMSVGTPGFYFQKLDLNGAPTGSPVTAASGLSYVDVGLAQSGDGFMLAGIYAGGTGGSGDEIDLYYMDGATGASRTFNWSLFHSSTNALDSLRVLRLNGKKVLLIWREANVGLHYFRVEPTFSAGSWSITQLGGATLDTSTAALTLFSGAGIL